MDHASLAFARPLCAQIRLSRHSWQVPNGRDSRLVIAAREWIHADVQRSITSM
jgi:hypothetical protein